MEIIQKQLVLKEEKYYEKHLEVINPFLPKNAKMTEMEIKVLSLFMSFTGEVAEQERFGTFLRKKVLSKLTISGPGLSNYIASLKKKGILVEGLADNLTIHNAILAEDAKQFYQFKIIKE